MRRTSKKVKKLQPGPRTEHKAPHRMSKKCDQVLEHNTAAELPPNAAASIDAGTRPLGST
jgi:hypothetical protein